MTNTTAEYCYEQCRALIKAIGCSEMDEADKDALMSILEWIFCELGDAIRIGQTK